MVSGATGSAAPPECQHEEAVRRRDRREKDEHEGKYYLQRCKYHGADVEEGPAVFGIPAEAFVPAGAGAGAGARAGSSASVPRTPRSSTAGASRRAA
jgi:hypothetical protein